MAVSYSPLKQATGPHSTRLDRYEAWGSKAWDLTMDVRSRPEWLKSAESKVFEPKLRHSFSHAALPSTVEEGGVDDEDDEGKTAVGDGTAPRQFVEVSVLDTSTAPPPSPPRAQTEVVAQFEQLRQRQQEQVQALLLQQTELAEQQMQIARAQTEVRRGGAGGCGGVAAANGDRCFAIAED